MKTINYFDGRPQLYQFIDSYILYSPIQKWLINSGRSSGKSINLANLAKDFVLSQPEGDIIILREYKSMHIEGAFRKIKNLFKEEASKYPILGQFVFYIKDNNMICYRVTEDNSLQRIHFLGILQGGVKKSKSSITYDKYISSVLIDEAEENDKEVDYQEMTRKKRLYIDFENTVSRRDKEKYKNYPQTKFIYVFNPNTESGVFSNELSTYLEFDEDKLLDDGFLLSIIPEYENSNGLAIFHPTYLMLEKDKKEFHITRSDYRKAEYLREHYNDLWWNIWMGKRATNITNIFGHYEKLINQKLPSNSLITYLGIDTGMSDNTVLTGISEKNFIDNEEKIINKEHHEYKWFPVFQEIYSGKQIMTLNQKNNHFESISNKVVDVIIEILKENIQFNTKRHLWIKTHCQLVF